MEIYTDLTLIAIIAIYIVDVSGFTESWRRWLAGKLHITALRALPPFDCGKCATWWSCLIYAAATGECRLETIAYTALLSCQAIPIGQFLIFIREALIALTNKLIDICSPKI